MKQVEVTILGQGYVLTCPEGGDALLASAVADVDREMTVIRDGGRVKARERIAVLAALNIAYQLAELRRQAVNHAASHAVNHATAGAAALAAGDGPAADVIDALVSRIDAVLESDGHLI